MGLVEAPAGPAREGGLEMTLNIATMFEAVAEAIPDRVILTCEGEHRTYAELEERANRLAHHLAGVGVGAGDHVAVHMRNRIEYVEALLACMKIRAVPINVNYRYTAAELLHVYTDSQSVALILEQEYLEVAAATLADAPLIRHVLVVAEPAGGPVAEVALPAGVTRADYETALADASPERGFDQRSADDRFVIYTGGTTGLPKGVNWRHEDFFFAALSGANTAGPPRRSLTEVVEAAVANDNAPVFLLIPPLMHGAAIYSLLSAFLAGSRRVISRDFDPVRAIETIRDEQITGITVVGDAIARPLAEAMTANPHVDVSSLKMIGSGGALFSDSVKDQLRGLVPGLVIKDAFGASETGNDGIVEFGEDGLKRIRSNPNMTLVDEDFQQVEVGQEGFIARGGHVPLGYFGDEARTASTFPVIDGVRMAVLGDMGRREDDGTIVLLGRGSTCINTGGEKVYPEEVEQALKNHVDVYDALVVGIPDERFGERVTAVVQLRPGATASPQQIAEFTREHVAGYKIPRVVVAVDQVRRSPSGKADYPWARETVLAHLG